MEGLGPLLAQPIQGALLDEGAAVCVAVAFRTGPEAVAVAIPADGAGFARFQGEGESVLLPLFGGAFGQVRFGLVPPTVFSDGDDDVDAALVGFSDDQGTWPLLGLC